MMTQAHRIALMAFVAMLHAACIGGQDEEEESLAGEASEALEYDNAVNPNAVNPNAVNPNALSPSLLSATALTPGTLNPTAMAALQDPGEAGSMSRAFVKYAVSCALKDTQSFTFSWTDANQTVHQESYPGLLALAPTWISAPLSAQGQRWVTACLASRANWYGVSVTISSRASPATLNKVGTLEMSTYTTNEGAFWGNVFTSSPAIYSCHHTPNIAHSRASYRDCAAGHLNANGSVAQCGPIQIVGACESHCQMLNPSNGHYPSCVNSGGSSTDEVITVYLP